MRERLAALIQKHAHVPKQPSTTYSGGDIGARLLPQALPGGCRCELLVENVIKAACWSRYVQCVWMALASEADACRLLPHQSLWPRQALVTKKANKDMPPALTS